MEHPRRRAATRRTVRRDHRRRSAPVCAPWTQRPASAQRRRRKIVVEPLLPRRIFAWRRGSSRSQRELPTADESDFTSCLHRDSDRPDPIHRSKPVHTHPLRISSHCDVCESVRPLSHEHTLLLLSLYYPVVVYPNHELECASLYAPSPLATPAVSREMNCSLLPLMRPPPCSTPLRLPICHDDPPARVRSRPRKRRLAPT